jgi:hypothetical protein
VQCCNSVSTILDRPTVDSCHISGGARFGEDEVLNNNEGRGVTGAAARKYVCPIMLPVRSRRVDQGWSRGTANQIRGPYPRGPSITQGCDADATFHNFHSVKGVGGRLVRGVLLCQSVTPMACWTAPVTPRLPHAKRGDSAPEQLKCQSHFTIFC